MSRVVAGACGAVVAAAVLTVTASVGLMSMLVTGAGTATGATTSVTSCTVTSGGGTADLDATQVRNARLIISIGKAMHVPPRGWVVAISAAMQESNLVNVDYGDRD